MATATIPKKPAADSAPNQVDMAWAAGFFDGEGCTTWLLGKSLMVAIEQNGTAEIECPAVLSRFARAVEAGTIGGPYHDTRGASYSPRRRPAFKWYAYGSTAVGVLEALLPFLSEPKRSTAVAAIHRFRTGGLS